MTEDGGCTANLKKKLFKCVAGSEAAEQQQVVRGDLRKVTIVGVGNVGMACAQTIISQNLCNELALVDVLEDKLRGEMLDLQHAAAFIPRVTISASTDYSITANSQICLITAGSRQASGEQSRRSLVHRNVSLLSTIVPQLIKYSPNTILLMISNPVDTLTYVAWKLSGLPSNRVIGTGTNLDSSRFRFMLADKLQLNASDVHGFMIGEHGQCCFPVRSSLNVAGVPLIKAMSDDLAIGKDLRQVQAKVIEAATEVIKLKGYTNWAIGFSAASLVRSILGDQRTVHPVSVLVKGVNGIKEEVFLSLPCVLARNGAVNIVEQLLEPNEEEQLREAVTSLWRIQQGLPDLS